VELTAEPIHVEAEPSLETPQKIEAETVEEPQEKTVAAQASIVETSASPQVQEPVAVETQKQELNADTRVEQQTVSILTSVKGIGEKRASQLNSLGINTVEELANASVEDLAKNLKVSPKIVAKWIEAAKQQ
jgi:predicted flap endonuclease-1-like 5' DNA nuclease